MLYIRHWWRDSLHDKILQLFRHYSIPRWTVLLMDTTLVYLAFIIAYLLRYNLAPTVSDFRFSLGQGLFVTAVYLLFILIYRSYSGLIRHTTIQDIFLIVISKTSSLVSLILLTLLSRKFGLWNLLNVPLSVLLIHYVLITAILFIMRIVVKLGYEFFHSTFAQRKNVLIFGAGTTGIVVWQAIRLDSKSSYRVRGFIDDSRNLQKKKLGGLSVYKEGILNTQFIKKENIQVLILAVKEIKPARKKQIINKALQSGLEVLQVPAVNLWLDGNLNVSQLKRVNVEDLLGREPIRLDMKMIEEGLLGNTILVTGAAGSIGSEIARQLTHFSTKMLVLVDQAETAVFQLSNEPLIRECRSAVKVIVADITNRERMEHIFRNYRPEVVFHAAAYKHVPLMEANPHEAFRVNVGGTKTVAELAVKYRVKKFVMISSDKAVNPCNVMGASKRICELYMQWMAEQSNIHTQFVTTRFGNVLGSSGSVIPLFTKQIEQGGPVTVTHPDVERFFMTIPEACQLVLEAGFMGKGGEIFVFDMGSSLKIKSLAERMIRLAGYEPGKDISITYIGLRPGEKMYEELNASHEEKLATYHPLITVAKSRLPVDENLNVRVEDILNSLYTLSEEYLIMKMKELVPDYRSLQEVHLS